MRVFISKIDAGRDVLIALGGSKITVFGESDFPTLAQPRLRRFGLHDARDERGFDLFRVLRWDYGLTKHLYGREDELSDILKFARSGGMAAEGRILCGEGGIGKTRLAAEAAACLAEEGWTAGFIPSDFRDRPFRLKGGTGLFLILDYPEERPEDTEFLIRLIGDLVEAPCRIRMLFLSRHDFTFWEDMAARCEGRLGRQEIGALQALEAGDCLALVEEAISNFSAASGFPPRAPPDPRPWMAEQPRHRSPLFLAAAAVHAVIDPAKAFGLSGPDILRSLAAREKRRVDHVSFAQKLGRSGLGQLLALTVIANGLDEAQVTALGGLGVVEGGGVIERVARTSWWRDGRLQRLEPDLLGAAFLETALFPNRFPAGRQTLPDWLIVALRSFNRELANRLARILFDCAVLHPGTAADDLPLARSLDRLLDTRSEGARILRTLSEEPATPWTAGLSARVARLLCDDEPDPILKARLLNNLAVRLSMLGEHTEALERAKQALSEMQRLDGTRADFVADEIGQVQTNIANICIDLRRFEEGLSFAHAALDTFKQSRIDRGGYYLDLAMALNAVSRLHSALGQREQALETALLQVEILSAPRQAVPPEDVIADLAGSLTNLSTEFGELGREPEALAAAKAAADVIAPIVRGRPEAFGATASGIYTNYANHLSAAGNSGEALTAAIQAVELLRPVFEARVEAHAPGMASVLANLATKAIAVGKPSAASVFCAESIGIHQLLRLAKGSLYFPEAANTHNTHANALLQMEKRDEALQAAAEAVTLARQTLSADLDGVNERLAMCLNTLARCYSELQDESAARLAADESLELCRELAKRRPEKRVFLALVLNNSAELAGSAADGRSNSAHLITGLDRIREAVSILAPLFLEQPLMHEAKMRVVLRNYDVFTAALDIQSVDANVIAVRTLLDRRGSGVR